MGQLAMSFLARKSADQARHCRLHAALVWAYGVAAALYALFIAATLDILAPLIFGAAYGVGAALSFAVTLVAWIRVWRGAPTLIMLSAGNTGQLMMSNLSAGVWPLLAAAALPLLPSIETLLACRAGRRCPGACAPDVEDLPTASRGGGAASFTISAGLSPRSAPPVSASRRRRPGPSVASPFSASRWPCLPRRPPMAAGATCRAAGDAPSPLASGPHLAKIRDKSA